MEKRERYKDAYKPGISIIVPTFKKEYISNIFLNYATSNYPLKELIIVVNNDKISLLEYEVWACKFKEVKVYRLSENYTLGECLNYGVSQAKYDYIARMDDDDYYGINYLIDLMQVFICKDGQVTGKNPIFIYFEEAKSLYTLNHSNLVMGATFLIKKEVFNKVKFRSLNYREDYYFLYDCINAGIRIIPSDIYNFIYMRHLRAENHTFRMSSKDMISIYNMKHVFFQSNLRSLLIFVQRDAAFHILFLHSLKVHCDCELRKSYRNCLSSFHFAVI